MEEVSRVASPSPEQLRELIARGRPFVATGLFEHWVARKWTLLTLSEEFAGLSTCVRLHPRTLSSLLPASSESARVPFEGECFYVESQVADFCRWLTGASISDDAPLARYPLSAFVGYADYQEMPALFAGAPAALGAVDWSGVVAASGVLDTACDGTLSTLWLGSSGSSTPLHYDTYGINFVAQLLGCKQWRLHPSRGSSPSLTSPRPTRVPYEESSVFGQRPSDCGDSGAAGEVVWIDVSLCEGELLHVPRHWWHEVRTVSSHALSINTWIDAREDPDERVREGIVRLIARSLIRSARRAGGEVDGCAEPPCGFINPTEDQEGGTREEELRVLNVALSTAALARAAPVEVEDCVETDAPHNEQPGQQRQEQQLPKLFVESLADLSEVELARALCIGPPIEAGARALFHPGFAPPDGGDRDEAGGSDVDGLGGTSPHGAGGERLRAPLGRLLRCAMLAVDNGPDRSTASASSAEPPPFAEALRRLRAAPGGAQVTVCSVIDALCTGAALDAAVDAVAACYRARQQQHYQSRKRGRGTAPAPAGLASAPCEHTTGGCDCDESCVIS
jgi:HSPB1-associated protein 1